MKFELDEEQKRKLSEFVAECKANLVAIQKKDPQYADMIVKSDDGTEHPYLGAIGGGVTYEFTPTGIGVFVTVTWAKGSVYEASVDLTGNL